MRLLKISILEDGWTMPLVVLADGTVIDGFHRWSISLADAEVRAITRGLVPVVRIVSDASSQKMSTIRHNRARGTHGVARMLSIIADLFEDGLSAGEISQRLQMDPEEVERLFDRGKMTKRRSVDSGLSRAWRPAPKEDEDD